MEKSWSAGLTNTKNPLFRGFLFDFGANPGICSLLGTVLAK